MERPLPCLACVLALLLMGWPGLAPASASAAGCLTAGCHGDMAKQKVHPGGMDCESCHTVPTNAQHPGGGTMHTDGRCTTCHQVGNVKHPHAPVAAGDCTACHNPHRKTADFLSKKGADLCLSCHADLIGKQMTEVHEPIRKGGCRPCHQAHGSSYSRLLVKPFPEKNFVSYADHAYQLCFSCHDRNMLRFPDTSFATGFRDGERNLHFLHVNKEKRGLSCKLCHVIHAGRQPELMAETVPFGNWALPLNFRKTATGGSCSPGCHGPASYDRNSGATVQRK